MKQRLWFGIPMAMLAASSALAAAGGGDVTFPLEGIPSVMFSHDSHVGKAKQKCSDCHYALYTNHAQRKAVGMSGMRQGKSCGSCHDGKRAFSVATKQNCEKCHKPSAPQQ